MFSWLLKRQMRVLAEADERMEAFGNAAYTETRSEARKAREAGDYKHERFLNRVCKEIAKRTDFEIGLDTATRYVEKQAPYVVDGPPIVRKRSDDTTLH